MGNVALAINQPESPAPRGWQWHPLTELARMASGHTPSRKRQEYWGGDIPWIGIKDAKRWHGGTVTETLEKTTQLGIDNSSARVLPAGTVCLSRTASVGYAVKMGREMATSQDFANWVCTDRLDPDFLRYLFIAEGSAFSRFSSGSVHQTIYYPELKAFHVCVPELDEQKRIVAVLDQALAALDRARVSVEKSLADTDELFERAAGSLFESLVDKYPQTPLVDLTDTITKGSSPRWQGIRYVDEPGVLFVTSENVATNTMDFAKTKFVEEQFNLKGAKSTLRPGDVLTNIVGASIGRTAVFDREGVANINQAVCLIRCKSDQLRNYFLSYLLNSPFFKKKLHEGEANMARANLSLTFFREFMVPSPPIAVQNEVVEKIDALNDKIRITKDEYGRQITAIADARRSLLAKAFAGELA